jgi:hypothetical protein
VLLRYVLKLTTKEDRGIAYCYCVILYDRELHKEYAKGLFESQVFHKEQNNSFKNRAKNLLMKQKSMKQLSQISVRLQKLD